MQNVDDNFKTKLQNISRNMGIDIIIDGCQAIFSINHGLIPIGISSWHTITFGEGFKFGDINPYTGEVLKFGDTIFDTNYTYRTYNVIDISNIDIDIDYENRFPKVPAVEISLYNNYYCQYIPQDTLGKKLTILYGSGTIAGFFVKIFEGIITEKKFEDNEKIIRIRAEHYFRKIKEDIFGKPMSALKNDISASDTTIAVDSTVDFPPTGYFRIDDELIQYTGISGNSFTGCNRALYSEAKSHKKNTKVEFVKKLQDRLPIILLNILTSTGNGNNGAYDILPKGCGIEIPIDYIDTYSFENYINPAIEKYNEGRPPEEQIDQNQQFDLLFYENIPAKKIISSILTILNAFLIIDNDMIIKLVPEKTYSSSVEFSNSNLIKFEQDEDIPIFNAIRMMLHTNRYTKWQKTEVLFPKTTNIEKIGEHSKDIYFILNEPFSSGYGKIPEDPEYPPGTPPPEPNIDPRANYINISLNFFLNRYKQINKQKILNTTYQYIFYEPSDIVKYNDIYYIYMGRNISIKERNIKSTLLEVSNG